MLLSLENVTFGFADGILLDDVSFTLSEGERVGLVGGNGEGKTTLLRLLLGELTPVEGKIFRKNGASLGYLPQTGGYDSQKTVIEEMRSVFERQTRAIEELRAVEREISALPSHEGTRYLALSEKYERLNKYIAATDAYQTEVKIRTVLGGMGFENDLEKPVAVMSGGEKTRLKFCRLLLEEPEILFLDEPTY